MDLSLGLLPSLSIAVVAALAVSLVYANRSALEWSDPDELVVFLAVGVSVAGSTFCFVLPILNMASNFSNGTLSSVPELTRILREEFANGVLALRVSSIHVGAQALLSVFAAIKLDPLPGTERDREALLSFPEQKLLLPDAQLTTYRNRFAHLFMNIVQCGVYELAIIVLWMLDSQAKRPLSAIALAWVLFYVVDDWRIIFRYSTATRGRMLPTHGRQIWIANIAITVLAATAAYQIGSMVLILFLILSYLLLRLLLLLMNGVEGDLMVVDALNWVFFRKQEEKRTASSKGDTEPSAQPDASSGQPASPSAR